MSDDRKRNARLQGKFSDPKESHSGRRDKQNEKKNTQNQNSSGNSEGNIKGQASRSRTAGGMNVEYQEDSKYTFKEQLSEKKKFKEIRDAGAHAISTTVNGTSRIIYEPNFLSEGEAEELFIILRDSTKWYDKNIVIRGQEYPQPRLVSWFGPYPYSYSGATLEAANMPSVIVEIKQRVEAFLGVYDLHVELNSVLLNYYRNGKDSVSWHSDDEMTMGVQPTIASVSLGEVRAFQMRPNPKSQAEDLDPDTRLQVNLLNGSLLIMDGCMQKDWQHQVPKEYHDKQERINLTFRTVYRIEDIPTEVPYSINESAESVSISKANQPKPVYDSDNFPPLSPASNPKINASNKTNSETQNSSLRQTDSTIGSCKVATVSESAIDPNESDRKPVTKVSCYSEACMLNELVDYSNAKDEAETMSTKVGNPCKNNLDTDEAVSIGGNKHKLNVNAPDFVPIGGFPDVPYPSTSFKGLNLRELSEFYSRCNDESCETEDFVYALIKELRDIQRARDYFQIRDWVELEVYIKLIECGHQSVENLRVINRRIFNIIDNKYRGRKNVPQRTPRGRSNFRGTSYRPH